MFIVFDRLMTAISASAAWWRVVPTESAVRVREKKHLVTTFALDCGDEDTLIDVFFHLSEDHIRCQNIYIFFVKGPITL